MKVYIGGQEYKFDHIQAIGKGGEADVYDLNGRTVAKIFKSRNHPDLAGSPAEQDAAEKRIMEHQRKLPAFPKGLPTNVIAPQDLVFWGKRKDTVCGYTMPFIQGGDVLYRLTEKSFRANVSNEDIGTMFKKLHETVGGIHAKQVVIGDFNDLNILINPATPDQISIIDADSMQYGGFPCHVFTAKFVDPLLCESDRLILKSQHTVDSDWYAFNIMLFQSLLMTGPYGGVYKPKDKTKKVGHDKRPLQRITIFDPEVRYPKAAFSLDILPDDLMDHFHKVFVDDLRGEFPRVLLDELEWTVCPDCGTTHAKHICPECGQKGIGKVVQTVQVRGTVTATRIFQTSGTIVMADYQKGKIRWLCHQDGKFFRENGTEVMPGNPERGMRFRVCGDKTVIAKGKQMITLEKGVKPDVKVIETRGVLPAFDTNGERRFWINNGVLQCDSRFGGDYADSIGDVLSGQTLFWTGDSLGFGYYRAGEYSDAFVFHTDRTGITDGVKIPPITGQIIDSTCEFSDTHVWFFVKTQEGAHIVNKCFVIDESGAVIASGEGVDGDGTWLGHIRGKCAVKNILMSATDFGIVRIVLNKGGFEVAKEYPDTEPFVSSDSHLYPDPVGKGIFVISDKEVTQLKLQ